jgi:hypothetical protein
MTFVARLTFQMAFVVVDMPPMLLPGQRALISFTCDEGDLGFVVRGVCCGEVGGRLLLVFGDIGRSRGGKFGYKRALYRSLRF